MVSVFLSHSSKDKPFVRNLADALEAGGEIKAWLDEREINYGDNIVRKIEEGLDADFVLLILSPDSVDSKWVREERTDAFWEQVNEDRIKLGIVLYRECKMPRLLRNKLYFDLRADHPEGFRKIRTWLLGHRPAPPPIVHLPQKPPLFIGRQPELAALRTRLQQEGSVVYIPGTPGRGKTTLALHYAHLHQRDFEAIHWLPCQSRSLAQIAAELTWQLGLKLDGDLDTILRELTAHCARKRCLLILDNVDDETPARLLPNGRASVLITTRYTNLRFLRGHKPLDLPLFTEDQCFDLFREIIDPPEEVDRHLTECRALFNRLGHLPFAIDVAASLIREDARYSIASMAKNPPADVYGLLASAIATLSPAAQTLLAAMAACAPEGFRLTLAAQIAELDEAAAFQPLNEIRSRSLADELDRDTHRYRLHALVREAAATTPAHHSRHAEAIRQQFEGWEANWRQCEQDLADWQTAFTWSLSQSENYTWRLAIDLTSIGYRLMCRLGRLGEAYDIAVSTAEQAKRREDHKELISCYVYQAAILREWGRLDETMALDKQVETLSDKLGDKAGLRASFGGQGLILKTWGQLDAAMAMHKREEALCRELGDDSNLALSLGNQALILRAWGRFADAMVLHKLEESLYQKLGDKRGIGRSYGNQALIFQACGHLNDAMILHKRKEALCIELGDEAGLGQGYGNQGLILKHWGKFTEAMALHKQEEAICVKLRDKAGLQVSYGNQAMILAMCGHLDDAMILSKRSEALCYALANKEGLAGCYHNQGLFAVLRSDARTGREKLKEAVTLFAELGMPRERDRAQLLLDQANGFPESKPS